MPKKKVLPYSEALTRTLSTLTNDIHAICDDPNLPGKQISAVNDYIFDVHQHVIEDKPFKSLSGGSYADEILGIYRQLVTISNTFQLGYNEPVGGPGSIFGAREAVLQILESMATVFSQLVKTVAGTNRAAVSASVQSLYDSLYELECFMHNMHVTLPLPEEPEELKVTECPICHFDIESEMAVLEQKALRQARNQSRKK